MFVLDCKNPPMCSGRLNSRKNHLKLLQKVYGVEDLDPVLDNLILQLESDIGFF